MVFPIAMYGCESWTIKKAECRRTDAFKLWCWRRLLRVPRKARISNQSVVKENQSWISIRRLEDTEAETPILWPPDEKNWLFGKDPDAGKDCRQEEKGKTEDEMIGWCHRLNGHEFEQAPFNFMAAVTIYSDFGVQENKLCHCFHCFHIYLPSTDGK